MPEAVEVLVIPEDNALYCICKTLDIPQRQSGLYLVPCVKLCSSTIILSL